MGLKGTTWKVRRAAQHRDRFTRAVCTVGDRRHKRVKLFDQSGKFRNSGNHLGRRGVCRKGDLLYRGDGTEANCLYILNVKDGKIVDKGGRLKNATAVTVDSKKRSTSRSDGANVRKLVKKNVGVIPMPINLRVNGQARTVEVDDSTPLLVS